MDPATIGVITSIVNIIADFISRVGFPIFVAVWLLIYTDKTLKSLTESLNRLADLIEAKLK